jgi:hypothetical protein
MAISAQIFRRGTSELIGVGIDMRLSEDHAASALVTRQVIEDGAQISDHIVLEPDSVEIVVEMSNVDQTDDLLVSPAGIAAQFGVQINPGSQGERARTAWSELKRQLQSRQLFDVMTDHELYTSMALEYLTGSHLAPHRGRLIMRLGFTRVDATQLTFTQVGEDQLDPENDAGEVVDPIAKTASAEVDEGLGVTITALERPNLIAIVEAKIAEIVAEAQR